MYRLRILDAAQFISLVTMDDVIPGVKEAYSLFSSGKAGLFPIITHEFDPGRTDMDIKSAYMEGSGIYGLKILGWNRDNPSQLGVPALAGLIVVMDIERQQPVGILEGTPVTFLRTGAAGAIGVETLARPESEDAVVVGSGAQGRAQLMGLSKVMPKLKKVGLFDVLDSSAEKMAEEVRSQYPGIKITAFPFASLEDHVRNADIIVTCTPSKKSFIKKDWLRKGSHINTIGADMPGKQEIDPWITANVRVFGDSRHQAAQKGECQHAVSAGLIKPDDITEIGEVLNGTKPGRMSPDEITMFDATGMALQDLIAAKAALERAEAQNIGTVVEMEQ
ncbi:MULTISPECIES: ornithine cyclodeaminase family protein [Synergistaceae]|jgi:ornithine cyclodeaminase/alanine dehydrogenase|uniref:ornithine cyclodeaminase family protein n=1 Tax=Synergistaceae TaxID=649777 RepID=UPI003AE3429B|nr:ornithine cyclodeaminase family protein [Synergistaceae bacterium DZ-S4]